MFKDPYQTTWLSGVNLHKVIAEIQQHRRISGPQFHQIKNPLNESSPNGYGVVALGPGLADVPPFSHPLTIKDLVTGLQEVYVDVRSFTRLDRDGNMVVSGELDYKFAVVRAFLQRVWNGEDWKSLLNLGTFPMTMFHRWLGGRLTRSYALPPEVQMRLTIIGGWYYLCQFIETSQETLDEKDRLRMASQIARSSFVTAEDVINTVENWNITRDIGDLVNLLKAEAGTARFEHLTTAQLYTVMNGGWFGHNSGEVLAVALEHVPTFITICIFAAQERGYHNTEFGKIAEQYKNADEVKSFLFNAKQLYF